MTTLTTGRATDFITFSRTSNATVTGADGRIRWAGHNLLTNSESFDASAWNKASASVSVTANAAAAPDGATTADKIIPSTGNVEHVIINNSAVTTVSGVQYTGAIYAKAAEYGFVFVSLDVTGSATACAVCVNLSDGTTSNTGGSGTYSVTSVGNGWWRISISATASTTSGYLAAYPRAAAGTTTAYVGTGTSGILLWGAHLYRSDLGSMVLNPARGDAYYPTTPRNLLGFTEDFSNAAWSRLGAFIQGNGVEVSTDPSFDTPSAWTAGTGITVSGGNAVYASPAHGTNLINTAATFVAGRTYVVNVTISAFTSGRITVYLNTTTGTSSGGIKVGGATGIYQAIITPATNGTGLGLQADGVTAGACALTLSSVTVQEIANFTAPNGLQIAEKLTEDTATGQHYVAVSAAGGGVNALSVYAKADGRNWLAIYLGTTNSTAWFNLASGATGTVQANVTASISSVGNGWYRCSVIGAQAGAGSVTRGFYMSNADNATTYTGDGTSGIYLWGAQLSDSASLDAYVPQYGAAVTSAAYYAPRLDFDGATLAAKGLLVEELRTNVLLHTADFTNAAWQASGATVSANTNTAPDGTLTADTVTSSGTDPYVVQVVNATQLTWTFSVWLKGVGASIGKQPMLFLIRDAYAEAINSGNLAALTSQWQRYTFTGTFASAPTQVQARIDTTNTSPASGDAVYIWGAQLEAGSFATSYIPTGASTATRTADVASVSTQAFPYSATEGTLVANFDVYSITSPNNQWIVLLGGSTNYIGAMTNPSSFRGLVVAGGSSQASMINGSVAANTALKGAIAFKANDFAATSGGAAVVTDTSGTVPTVSTMQIGSFDTTNYLNGHIRQITYLPRRISNAELQSRSA